VIPKPKKTVLVKKAKEPDVEKSPEVVSPGVGDSEDWRSEFECPVCLEMMWSGVQIYQCVSGHLVCGECRGRMESNSCPTCRGDMTGRATVMERLAAALLKQ